MGKEKSVVKTQLLNSIPNNSKGSYIIAYEPVWAIGSGITPNIDEIKGTGVDGVAVINAIFNQDNPSSETLKLISFFNKSI